MVGVMLQASLEVMPPQDLMSGLNLKSQVLFINPASSRPYFMSATSKVLFSSLALCPNVCVIEEDKK